MARIRSPFQMRSRVSPFFPSPARATNIGVQTGVPLQTMVNLPRAPTTVLPTQISPLPQKAVSQRNRVLQPRAIRNRARQIGQPRPRNGLSL